MLSIHESPVFKLTYDLLKDIHLARHKFLKSEKYTLGEHLEQSVLEILLDIVDAGRMKKEWKISAIDRALQKLEKTKILIRLAWDLKQIPEGQVCTMQETVQKIGRMLGGWRKSI